MELYLKIDQNEAFEFFEAYDRLSPLQQKVWDKIAALTRSWTNVIPSQSRIAEWCGCSRSAVSEAFRKFRNLGWLYLESRGYKKSKRIVISHSRRQLDTKERKYFKSVVATYRATHTKHTKIDNTSKAREIAIAPYLEKKNLPLKAKLKLSMVGEYIYQETYYQCQKIAKSGFKPKDEIAYFVGTAIRMAEKQGVKLNWRGYHEALGKHGIRYN